MPVAIGDQKLYLCEDRRSQREWMREALLAGKVLSDTRLWLAGVDEASREIRLLRRSGMKIATTKIEIIDAEGEASMDLAWRAIDCTNGGE